MSSKKNTIGTLPIISKIHGKVFSQLCVQSPIYFLLKPLTPLNYLDLDFMATHPISGFTNQITPMYHEFQTQEKIISQHNNSQSSKI